MKETQIEKNIVLINADIDEESNQTSSINNHSIGKKICVFLNRKSTLIAIILALIFAGSIAFLIPQSSENSSISSGVSLPSNFSISSKAAISEWITCNPSVDTCPVGRLCCVAPADVSSGKATCRLANLPENHNDGCASVQPSSSSSSSSSSYPVSTDYTCGGGVGFSCPQIAPCCSQYGK